MGPAMRFLRASDVKNGFRSISGCHQCGGSTAGCQEQTGWVKVWFHLQYIHIPEKEELIFQYYMKSKNSEEQIECVFKMQTFFISH